MLPSALREQVVGTNARARVAEEIETCKESNVCRRVRFPRPERGNAHVDDDGGFTPCVQNCRDADVGSEVFGIGSNDSESLRCSSQKQAIDSGLVLVGDSAKSRRWGAARIIETPG